MMILSLKGEICLLTHPALKKVTAQGQLLNEAPGGSRNSIHCLPEEGVSRTYIRPKNVPRTV